MRDKSGLWKRGRRGRMNIYLIGMIISMVVFAVIGAVISRKIRNAEDFYVAGRNAPVILIAGSLIASYSSTGMFMGMRPSAMTGRFHPSSCLQVCSRRIYLRSRFFWQISAEEQGADDSGVFRTAV